MNFQPQLFWPTKTTYPGIDSKELIPPAYLAWRAGTTILHRLAESIPWNRYLGSLNVYKFGLCAVSAYGCITTVLTSGWVLAKRSSFQIFSFLDFIFGSSWFSIYNLLQSITGFTLMSQNFHFILQYLLNNLIDFHRMKNLVFLDFPFPPLSISLS